MDSNARKNIIYSLVLILLVLVVYLYRSRTNPSPANPGGQAILVNFDGEFLGQPYLVLYHSSQSTLEKTSIDSVLNQLSEQISSESSISQLNLKDTLFNPSRELLNLLRTVVKASESSKFAWDPTQPPLDKIWSFSSYGPKLQDSVNVSDVMAKVGLGKLIISDTLIRKTSPEMVFNLNDFGQANAIDQLSALLSKKGIQNYFIQIGRHAFAKGVNEKQELWKAKTIFPVDSTGIGKEGWIALQDQAISISGDMSSFYRQDSLRKPFRIDPRTGYPVNHGLLVASVLAKDSKTAATFAEALLVQGWQEGISLDSIRKDLEMVLIFNEKGAGIKVYASPDLRPFLSFPIE